MEAVMPVLVEVQRERDRPNQFLLHLPRLIARQPDDEPIVQGLFARGESSSASAAHTPQIDAQETSRASAATWTPRRCR